MLSSVALGVLLSSGDSVIDLDGTMFVQMAIFFVAFFVLKGLVFGPVMNLFDAREAAMGGAKADAERMEQEAADKREHFEAELRKVRQQANEDRERLRAEGQKLARELTEKARTENNETLNQARSRLGAEAAAARDSVQAEVPRLAKQIASKLLNRSLS